MLNLRLTNVVKPCRTDKFLALLFLSAGVVERGKNNICINLFKVFCRLKNISIFVVDYD